MAEYKNHSVICSLIGTNVTLKIVIQSHFIGLFIFLKTLKAHLLNVCVVDTDAQSYACRTVDAVLCSDEQEKERKYLAAVEERRASFTPFVVSVDGVLGHDAQHLIKRLCDQIAMKWEKSHSEVMVWVRARIAFAILRATNLCLRGSRVKWRSGHGMDDGAGLPHFP